MDVTVLCEACHQCFTFPIEEEPAFDRERIIVESTGVVRRRYICDNCYQNNWKFTEHGVLMNETPVKKKGKK